MSGRPEYSYVGRRRISALMYWQSEETLNSIRDLMPPERGTASTSRRRWSFVLNKSKIDSHRRRLKELQVLFIFMKVSLVDAVDRKSEQTAGASSRSDEPSPVTLTGKGRDVHGNPVSYEARLFTRSTGSGRRRSRAKAMRAPKRSTVELVALRQSPYFSAALLQGRSETAGTWYACRAGSDMKAKELDIPSGAFASRDVERYLGQVRMVSPLGTTCSQIDGRSGLGQEAVILRMAPARMVMRFQTDRLRLRTPDPSSHPSNRRRRRLRSSASLMSQIDTITSLDLKRFVRKTRRIAELEQASQTRQTHATVDQAPR